MYHKTILDNGLKVITEELPFFKSAAIGIWVNTGSRNENDKNNGISHFIEHMLFKGTETKTASDIAEIMDGVGGVLNAFTEKEQTCFYSRVLDRHVDLAVDLLFDLILHSTFDKTELERERGVILDEIRMYDDSPEDIIMDMFSGLIWNKSSLGRPVIGIKNTVEAISRDSILEYMQSHYTSENIIVCAAGNIKHDDFLKMTEKHAKFLNTHSAPQKTLHVTSGKDSRVRVKDCEQAYVIVGREGLKCTDDNKYCLNVIDSILGSSMSSRIFQEVREKRGLAYNIGSFSSCLSDTGLFGIFAGTSPSTLQEVTDVSLDITEKMKENGATAAELSRSQEQLKGNISLALESTSGRMMRLAKSEFLYGRLVPPEEVFDKIDAVTLDKISDLSKDILNTSDYSSCVLGPVEKDLKIMPEKPVDKEVCKK